MPNRLTVTGINVADNKLIVRFSCKGQINKFFEKNTFIVEYSTSIEGTPESILVIPFLASVCPIAWANQADVYVEIVDEMFLGSLVHVQKTLQKFYPQMGFSGRVFAKKVVASRVGVQANSMLLFSGGVDSLATFVRHQAEKPILVSVHGVDMEFDDREAWDRFTGHLQEFSDTTGSAYRTIRYGFLKTVDWCLFHQYFLKISGRDWWERVMQGPALLGLCAPLTYVDKVGKLYIAATFPLNFQPPHGSHPEIDNYVRWSGTRAIHDGLELSRQEKINFFADYLKNKNPNLYIHACLKARSDRNCGLCEKCARTILGLELGGIDPNEHGFAVDDRTFSRIKSNLTNGAWTIEENQEFMWVDLQAHASRDVDLPHPGARVLIDWLLATDVEALRSPPPKPSRLFQFFKYLPYPVYRLTMKSYLAVNKLIESLKGYQIRSP